MSEGTKISWCDDTVNVWSGCAEVGPGCVNCYARELAKRFSTFGGWGKGAPRQLHESAFKLARKINRKPWVCDYCGRVGLCDKTGKLTTGMCQCRGMTTFHRRRIFSLSLGDWLDPEVPAEWLARMLDTVRQCPDVTWMLCTKRPELWKERMREATRAVETQDNFKFIRDWYFDDDAPKHVITLTSVENQATADERIPHALRIPSACRGLSMEPLLGPVNLTRVHFPTGCLENVLKTEVSEMAKPIIDKLNGIDWIILGGESGPKARPCNVEWIRDLLRQGQAAQVPVFVKQVGQKVVWSDNPTEIVGGELDGLHVPNYELRRLKHSKGGDPAEWPADLRVREWPKGF